MLRYLLQLVQPELALPRAPRDWSYTSGPHAAWGAVQVRAALDFAPPMDAPGCRPTNDWVVAVSPGLVVRSQNGAVVEDLDVYVFVLLVGHLHAYQQKGVTSGYLGGNRRPHWAPSVRKGSLNRHTYSHCA